MPWVRLGAIYVPEGNKLWARSHAALPTPVQMGPDRFRFFFSARDHEQRSHVGWVDVEFAGDPKIVGEAAEPVLSPGPDGTFDDSGVSVTCIVERRLYYLGWNLGTRVPWRNAIGMAVATNGFDRFERFSPGPILDRSPEDPFSLSYPWVLRAGPEDWRMWYGSSLEPGWTRTEMRYALKSARSRDGVRWERDGRIAIGFATPDETAIARPSVVTAGDRLLMCFAYRGERYRIGAAWSRDGSNWSRIDAATGLAPAMTGWDAEMTCYPALFRHRDRLWLAYNGNGYGASGFGLARWEGALPFEPA